MKKILYLLILVLVTFSCTELTDLNKNVKDPESVPGETLFTGAQKNMVDQLTTCNVNFGIWELIMQYWTEVTYTDESNYDLTTRTIPDGHWQICYRDVLRDLNEAKKLISAPTYPFVNEQKIQKNKLAIIEIFSIFSWAVLVETFGDVPYSEALDILNLLPEYQDGEVVYRDLLARLVVATNNLDVAYGSFSEGDNIYQGDVAKWKKFANSLRLRMGMLFADIDNTYARGHVEAAVTAGVFTSNDDNALFSYGSSQPNTNPLYVDLIASGRLDFVACDTIVDLMNALDDPRRPFYFTTVGGLYVGGENGVGTTYASCSNQAPAIKRPTFKGNILDYAQVEFLLAEARERLYAVGGSGQSHYNDAIKASIEFWAGSSPATAASIATYLARPDVDYLNALSGATWKDKIGTQAWIAFYIRGFDAWTTQRRLNVPSLIAPPDAVSGFPVRYTYPIGEQTLNGANYRAASTAIGGDEVETRLFFDIN